MYSQDVENGLHTSKVWNIYSRGTLTMFLQVIKFEFEQVRACLPSVCCYETTLCSGISSPLSRLLLMTSPIIPHPCLMTTVHIFSWLNLPLSFIGWRLETEKKRKDYNTILILLIKLDYTNKMHWWFIINLIITRT